MDDYEISHFGTWCCQVLTTLNCNNFTSKDTDASVRNCNMQKFCLCHFLNRGSVLTVERPFSLDMEYPEFTWKSIGNDTEQDAQFRREFMNAFLDGRTLPTPPPVVPHAEAEIPAKLKRESS